MFWASSGLRCPLKDPPGSPMVPNGHPSVLLDFWMKYSSMGWFDYGKTGPCLHGRWSKEYLLIWRIFQALWVPNRPPRLPRAPNGRPYVPWEVEIKSFTMGWLHCGKTGCCLCGGGTKKYLRIGGIVCPFSGSGGPPSNPQGPQWFLMNNLVCHDPWVVEIRCFTMGWFHFGKTKFYSLDWWTDEFRYVFAVFWLWGASSRARGLPMIPDGLPSVPWEVELKYFTMGWLYYGKTACCIHGRWTKE